MTPPTKLVVRCGARLPPPAAATAVAVQGGRPPSAVAAAANEKIWVRSWSTEDRKKTLDCQWCQFRSPLKAQNQKSQDFNFIGLVFNYMATDSTPLHLLQFFERPSKGLYEGFKGQKLLH